MSTCMHVAAVHLCALTSSRLPPRATTQHTSNTAHTNTYARCATTTPAAASACFFCRHTPTTSPLSLSAVVLLLCVLPEEDALPDVLPTLSDVLPLVATVWVVACAADTAVGCGCAAWCCCCRGWCCCCCVCCCCAERTAAAAGSLVHWDAMRLPRSSAVSSCFLGGVFG